MYFSLPRHISSSAHTNGRLSSCVVSGGGPGGLTLAATLARFNHSSNLSDGTSFAYSDTYDHRPVSIDIYEAQSELATVGAGVSVYPRTQTILRELGVLREELEAGNEKERCE